MDPLIGRKTWRTLEAYHGAIYFVPEAGEEYAKAGVTDWMSGYFASRSAAMGAVNADVVIATFFNFDHGLVRRSMDGVWNQATPSRMLEARFTAVDRMLRRHVLDDADPAQLRRAAELARIGAEAASERPEGRPLFAGHAEIEWPDDDHLVLWHAQTLLREYRGDGHLAALTAADLNGCEALVTHGAAGEVPSAVLKGSRQRTEEQWNAALESLRSRGWLDDAGEFTDVGRAGRQQIEDSTDALATRPYAAIGEDGCSELRTLVRPWSAALAAVFPKR
jgi:hypothetical protein